MLVVTGTKRSGTSMWMQLLQAAGFPVIGKAFPHNWGSTLRAGNPRGYYESQLIRGVYHRTNPNPRTGAFLFPEQVRDHAVKVFVPGLVRSDLAYLDRVIATIRPWREVVTSLGKLRALSAGTESEELDESRRGSIRLPPVLEWWAENFGIVRDVATRRYPVHFVSYASLVESPEQVLGETFDWLGSGDVSAAIQAVDPALHRNVVETLDHDPAHEAGLPAEAFPTFDLLYDRIHRGLDLDPATVDELNATNRLLLPYLLEYQARASEALVERLYQAAQPDPTDPDSGQD